MDREGERERESLTSADSRGVPPRAQAAEAAEKGSGSIGNQLLRVVWSSATPPKNLSKEG